MLTTTERELTRSARRMGVWATCYIVCCGNDRDGIPEHEYALCRAGDSLSVLVGLGRSRREARATLARIRADERWLRALRMEVAR